MRWVSFIVLGCLSVRAKSKEMWRQRENRKYSTDMKENLPDGALAPPGHPQHVLVGLESLQDRVAALRGGGLEGGALQDDRGLHGEGFAVHGRGHGTPAKYVRQYCVSNHQIFKKSNFFKS